MQLFASSHWFWLLHCFRSVLNICFPYTSRQEMAHAASEALANTTGGSPSAIDDHLYTADCPPVDLLIRTSGEIRLSDFMLWQCNKDTQIYFVPVFWPEFSFLDMLRTLLEFNLGRTSSVGVEDKDPGPDPI